MNVWILFIKAAGREINARLLFITVQRGGGGGEAQTPPSHTHTQTHLHIQKYMHMEPKYLHTQANANMCINKIKW